jgi:hypothetical protein
MLPALEPATIDGKPIAQKFRITITFDNGQYSFKYIFLPIESE